MTETFAGQRVVLRSHPKGRFDPSDFALESYNAPMITDGEFLIRNLLVSVDPMVRLFVDAKPLGGAFPAMPLGATIPGPAVGEVIESRHADFAVGDLVEGRFGWQNFAASNGVGVNRVSPALGAPENALGIGGLPGFTAYVGLHAAGGVKPGQTVLVSGAAGGVGSAVGALVRARGGHAVGIASGDAKRRYLIDQVGYAAVADRTAPDFLEQLGGALPKGADIYFDNVGGALLAKVAMFMARGGLVLISGLMAQYEGDPPSGGSNDLPVVLRAVMGKGLRIHSFSQFGQEALRPAFAEEIARLFASGKIVPELHVQEGIEHLPHALWGLFNKSVTGKVVVRVGRSEQRESRRHAVGD
jgi:NADPH-dependent curcumin reductase